MNNHSDLVNTLIELDDEQWQQFITFIESPPRELPALKLLLNDSSVFEIAYIEDCEIDTPTV